MNGASAARGRALTGNLSAVVLVTRVGTATGSRAAAAALACAGSEPDRAALLIDLDDGRPPRPSLFATAGARELEERLAVHLPEAGVASRGQLCQLTLPAEPSSLDGVAAALPTVRDSVAVIHLPPSIPRALLGDPRIRPAAALLRANLATDRALTALAVRDLRDRGLCVAVLKRPLGWVASRAAQLGALPAGNRVIPIRMCERLLEVEDSKFRQCYDGKDETRDDRHESPRQERSGSTRARGRKEEKPSRGKRDRA